MDKKIKVWWSWNWKTQISFNKMLVSKEVSFRKNGFKCFDETEYICFYKNLAGKYNELWNKLSSTIKNKFDCPIDDEKCLRTKMREKSYKGKISTNLLKDKIQRSFSVYLLIANINSFCFYRKLKLLSSSIHRRI